MAPYPQLHACMLNDGPLSPVACMLTTLPSEQVRESVEARACMPIALPICMLSTPAPPSR